jgi:predicted transcriptional regulator
MAKLFSIKNQYSEKIYSEEKLVEFRRQNVNTYKNEMCFIYTSSPVKKINGYFIVKEKIRASINKLWKMTKDFAGITYSEFKEYFDGCLEGTALIFEKVKEFSNKIGLDRLRELINGFRPPQSYYNLENDLLRRYKRILFREELNFS